MNTSTTKADSPASTPPESSLPVDKKKKVIVVQFFLHYCFIQCFYQKTVAMINFMICFHAYNFVQFVIPKIFSSRRNKAGSNDDTGSDGDEVFIGIPFSVYVCMRVCVCVYSCS